MHRRSVNLLLPLLVLSGATAAIGATHGPAASSAPSACTDSAEAAEWREELSPLLTGMHEGQVEWRAVYGLPRIDSTAIHRFGDGQHHMLRRCNRSGNHPVLAVPYRVVAVRFGLSYVVAIVDTSPPPPGLKMTGHDVVMILDAATLNVIHDNMLM